MRESRLYGSVRGALSNGRPYRVVRRPSLLPDKRTKNGKIRAASIGCRMTRLYGPAVRGKRFRQLRQMRSCVNVSGL
jgi:hypothetical protein